MVICRNVGVSRGVVICPSVQMWVCPEVWLHFNMVQGCGHLSKCVSRGVIICPSVEMWVCPGVWSHFNMVQGCGHLSKCGCVRGCGHILIWSSGVVICRNVGVSRGVVICKSVQMWVCPGVWSYVHLSICGCAQGCGHVSIYPIVGVPRGVVICPKCNVCGLVHMFSDGCVWGHGYMCPNVGVSGGPHVSMCLQMCVSTCPNVRRYVWGVSTCPNVGVSRVCLHVQM